MKKILFTLAIVISGLAVAQQSKSPLVILDGSITSESFMKHIDTRKIESVNIYKNSIPDYLKGFEGARTNGIIDIKMKENPYDKISLAELNTQYKLPANNPVSFDGQLLKDTKMTVIANAITSMKVNQLEGREVLFLDTTPN